MVKAVITGATGMIGIALIDVLIKKDYEIDKAIDYIVMHTDIDIKYSEFEKLYKEIKNEWSKPKIKDYKKVPYAGLDNNLRQKFNRDIRREGKKNMKLEVIKEITKVVSRELKGNYGTYIVDETGVKKGDEHFKSIEEIEAYEKQEIERFAKEMNELRIAFQYME